MADKRRIEAVQARPDQGHVSHRWRIHPFVDKEMDLGDEDAVSIHAQMEIVRPDGLKPETKGVTAKLLATVDLGPEIEGMAGRQLRMRMVTIEPGGVFGPIHDHKDRPGTVYILQGTITDHRNGVATDYGPGVGWPEDRNTTHWLENRGTIPAVEISVDIVRQE
jgi:quercetin dioxygenase-like cupin family protein